MTTTTYDVDRVRAQFPALAHGIAHFDGPGGSQVPSSVARAVADTMTGGLCQRGTLTETERRTEAVTRGARAAVGDLLGVDPGGVVFGRSMTQLTMDMARTLAASQEWGPGDEVVVSRLDHDSNIRPWVIAAESVGATVRWLDFDPATAEVADIETVLTTQTRLVALTAASNLFGTRPDVPAVAAAAHEVGALVYVDAVHLTPHAPVDAAALGADLHRLLAVQVLRAAPRRPRRRPGAARDAAAGQAAAVDGRRARALRAGHAALRAARGRHRRRGLHRRPRDPAAGVRRSRRLPPPRGRGRLDGLGRGLRGRPARPAARRPRRRARRDPARLPAPPHPDGALLGRRPHAGARCTRGSPRVGVNAPSGSFYALEASRRAGLGDDGAVRAGIAPYTSPEDVDRLVEGVSSLAGPGR